MRSPLPFRLLPLLRFLLLPLLFAAPSARAHRRSDACLRIQILPSGLEGRLDVPLRDLAELLPLDANCDGDLTWGELRAQGSALRALIDRNLHLRSRVQGPLSLNFDDPRVVDQAGETCASIAFHWPRALPAGPLELEYRLLAEVDPQHRGLLRWEQDGRVETAVLGPDAPTAVFDPSAPSGEPGRRPWAWSAFVREGIHHIATGYDHLLFLLALLLPAVRPIRVLDTAGEEGAKTGLVTSLRRIVQVVTAFTLAHSITLLLAALKVVRLPSAPIEVAIAASVALAALNNLLPLFRDHTPAIAFGFGLIHGFGFAGVLSELDLPVAEFVPGVLGFNLGVELGQLAIVGCFLPVAFALRHSWIYRRVALPGGSGAIFATALFWVAQRSLSSG